MTNSKSWKLKCQKKNRTLEDQPDMNGISRTVEISEDRDSRLETELLQEMLKHEKNKTYAENILGSELPLQELVKHQRSEMNYLITCTSKFPLQELTKHLNNIVYELQIFRQKYSLTVVDLLLTNSRLWLTATPEKQGTRPGARTLTTGSTKIDIEILQRIRRYNIVKYDNFTPTFKVKWQIYHQIGSLLLVPE